VGHSRNVGLRTVDEAIGHNQQLLSWIGGVTVVRTRRSSLGSLLILSAIRNTNFPKKSFVDMAFPCCFVVLKLFPNFMHGIAQPEFSAGFREHLAPKDTYVWIEINHYLS